MLGRVGSFLSNIAVALWGKFDSREEVRKFAYLALIFGLIIGVYWTLRPIKDSVFMAVVGPDYLWLAKILSLCMISPLVVLYGKLIDMYPRHKVFYALAAVYGPAAILFGLFFMHPELGLMNKTADFWRISGWAWYVFVESFGSLVVALFWAFTADTTAPDSAKRGFPIIAMAGQLGNILGPRYLNTKKLGLLTSAPIIVICGSLVILLGFVFWYFMRVTPAEQLVGYRGAESTAKKKGSEPGFLEGLRLLLTESYLFGIFLIIGLYELVVTIIDNHFKVTVASCCAGEGAMSAFLSNYAEWVGIIAFLSILLGINNITRYLGMFASLVMLPVLMGGFIVLIYFNQTSALLPFWIMVFSKAVNYALNQPTLKQLYIPTSHDAKYKSQAWLEMFGSRGSKAAASFYNGLKSVWSLNLFMTVTLFASFGIVGLWLVVVTHVSKLYGKAIKNNEVVC